MPATLETISVELETVEVQPGKFASGYPLLKASGGSVQTELPVVVLANRWLRAMIVPSLGGRIVELCQSEDSLRRSQPVLVPSPIRGVRLDWGIELSVDGRERPNSMGPVDFQVLEEEGTSGVVMGELTPMGLSWHMRASLPDERAALRLDVRVFNRELRRTPYSGGLLVSEGVVALAEPGTWGTGNFRCQGGFLAPRQTDSFSCELVPGSGLGAADAIVVLDGSAFELRALESMPGHKVVVRAGGRDFETLADLDPSMSAHFDLGDLGAPEAIAVVALDGRVRFRWDAPPPVAQASSLGLTADPASDSSFEEAALKGDKATFRRAALDAGNRAGAYIGLAIACLREGEVEAARVHLEDALLFNGDDPLAWWLRAALDRREGVANDGTALLNAHFLAPFDPMLRAEAFLSTPVGTNQTSDVVRPLAGDPLAMVEVAVRLHELGWYDDLSRWVDECLRHGGHPMLRYLLADALLFGSRMDSEAAKLVAEARSGPLAPPFPWKLGETAALGRLSKRFPEEGRLAEWLDSASEQV